MTLRLAACVLAAFILATPALAAPSIGTAVRQDQAPVTRASVVDLFSVPLARINELRAQAGVAPLTLNAQLVAAAQGHADDMVAKGYFSHTGPDGRGPGQRLAATGYQASTWGENIASGYADWNATITAWMGSAGHRANLLNARFKELGLGLASRRYVADLATPRSGTPTPEPPPSCPSN
ncbi:MAG: CAP domain-containing protein [Geminicoccaceae bacterium]